VTSEYIQRYLDTWASKGVTGHFKQLKDGLTKPWVDIDENAQNAMSKLVGANPEEVAVMQTLTANLHLLLLSFYQPTSMRFEIIMESKAFPSDNFAVQSQLAHHKLYSRDALILLEPSAGNPHYYSTEDILKVLEKHRSSAALLLLPGVQYYTGQLFDIARITKYAHDNFIRVGWDLAHAVGNVDLELHNWGVDFAVWCSYKYLNAGAGSIGGLFVHSLNGRKSSERPASSETGSIAVDFARDLYSSGIEAEQAFEMRHRLTGWWGCEKESRFDMDNLFVPMRGAASYQLSNPSVLDTTSLLASLSVFAKTDMMALRKRSIRLTAYLEYLLLHWPSKGNARPYKIITPSSSNERGAQLSVLLEPGLLEGVMKNFEKYGVVVDERKPDVIRIAPVPLYNNFQEVWKCVNVLREALNM
jgi:kynureninase